MTKIHVKHLCNVRHKKAYSDNKDDITCTFCLRILCHYRPWKQRVILQYSTYNERGIDGIKPDNFCMLHPLLGGNND